MSQFTAKQLAFASMSVRAVIIIIIIIIMIGRPHLCSALLRQIANPVSS
jgi:hypothetical protein